MTEPHSTDLYTPAGRGKIYIAEWTGTTPPTYPGTVASNYPTAADIAADPGDFVEMGNCPSFELEPVIERRPHYSSREGLKTKDLDPVVGTEYNVTIEADELASANLKRFFMGDYNAATGILSGLQNANREYALIFIATNPIGPKNNQYLRRLTLGPNGPLQLIGDEYLVMSFSGSGLADVSNFPASPYFDIKNITTTTTSTTTTTA